KDVQDGVQLKVDGGTITAYSTGNAQVQGKNKKQLEDILNEKLQSGSGSMTSAFKHASFDATAEAKLTSESVAATKSDSVAPRKRVFIVHGHDKTTRLELANFLYRSGYEPVVLADETDGGATIIEKLERELRHDSIAAAIVLATDDDIYAHPTPTQQYTHIARCRPNVELELGFVIGRLGREKFVFLRKSVLETVEFVLPSDVLGVVFQPFSDLSAVKHKILSELAHITGS
ncbi:tirC, partial [Symbiodinium microadriaticum]